MNKEQIVYKKIEELKLNPKNPRHNDGAVDVVAKSIEKYGFKNPLIIDSNNIVWCGNTRLKASHKLGLKEVPCIIADDLTQEQIRELALIDNKSSEIADWDYDLLSSELSALDLSDFDLDWGILNETETSSNESKPTLVERFGIPPFSVFDTKQGYWQDRKREWLDLGIKSELGRKDDLIGHLKDFDKISGSKGNGTSIFDPVLCEIIYKWFCVEKGTICDCFAGGSVRGVVAEKLGFKYLGIDLREEQIEANYKNAEEIGVDPTWICDDSLNIDKYVEDNSQDFIFSCPPYADLEKYSDDERDLSNMEYDDFKNVYFEIIKRTCKKLKNDRFACFVVGDVRDKNGFYYNFVDDTKKAFIDSGLNFYNEIILLNSVGSASLRTRQFEASRKVVKCHQNVLVFYKGNPKNIKNNFKEIFIDNIKEDEDDGEYVL